MKTSVVILTYNRKERLEMCLSSIADSNRLPNHVYVVDNAKSEDIKNMMLSKFPFAYYIEGNNDLGVIARNMAIEQVEDEIIFQVDDDAMVSKNWDFIIEKYFKDSNVGAIGMEGHFLDGWLGFDGNVKTGEECDFVTGYLWAFRKKEGWKYPNELKKFWREESWLNLTIKKDGYKIIKCEPLGVHASARTEIDWSLHDLNTSIFVDYWRNEAKKQYENGNRMFCKYSKEQYNTMNEAKR